MEWDTLGECLQHLRMILGPEFERKIIDNTDVYLDSTQKEGKVLSKLSFVESQKAMLQDLKGFRDIDSAEHLKELQDSI